MPIIAATMFCLELPYSGINLPDVIVLYCRPPSLCGLRRRGGEEERFEERNLVSTRGKEMERRRTRK